jgi:hypothetical protein
MNKYLSRIVRETLSKNKESRDDWMLVIKEVHDKELSLWCYDKKDYYDAFFSEKLSNVGSIVRLWRLIQEKCPELRGEEWELRQRQGGLMAKEIVEDNQLKLWD